MGWVSIRVVPLVLAEDDPVSCSLAVPVFGRSSGGVVAVGTLRDVSSRESWIGPKEGGK
jgi:hypothetical protein